MLYIKSIPAKKIFVTKVRPIPMQIQLFEGKKQNTATVEATNHDAAAAETMLNMLNRQRDSIIIVTLGEKITERGAAIGWEVV